ncbi:von Willebrand factor type A domain-containing protein [Rhodopirellula sp. MGV]|uniref:YfbK domain-containing protein n=1 Tax=Rhodopirellula sp. MGV TaxID=2023130 RepID=UPI000B963260|nr:von Willebrand factor type A domain-containing protein [Rhodopirellula sp. MGV]OYP36368.1 hypothetical protein CGZ80_08630 [Rhodopirellula sp. MGV]PNY38400.1 DUF3520 domain-containing protein [Rhodopirellula baltica]
MIVPNDSDPNDLQLHEQATAFVFGELSAQQEAEFVQRMEHSPTLCETVNAIRETATTLASEFDTKTQSLSEQSRQTIEAAIRRAEQVPVPPIEPGTSEELGVAQAVPSPQSPSSSFGFVLAIAASLLLACGLTLPALNRVISARTETKLLRSRIQEVERQNRLLAERNRQFESQIQSLQVQLALDRQQSTVAPPSSAVVNNDQTSTNNLDTTADVNPVDVSSTDVAAVSNQTHEETASNVAAMGSAGDSLSGSPSDLSPTNLDHDLPNENETAVDDPSVIAADVLESQRLMDDTLSPSRVKVAGQSRPFRSGVFESAAVSPLSNFPINIERESYWAVRKLIDRKSLPQSNDVYVEQLINTFDYEYARPEDGKTFAVSMDIASCPWNPSNRLARVGIQGRESQQSRRPANLVFLVDVSGTMNRPEKLPLAVKGLLTIVEQLDKNDSLAIVVYSGAKGIALDATTGDQKLKIIDAIHRIRSGGSTKSGEGLQLAYRIAQRQYIPGGNNAVILCTDNNCQIGFESSNELADFVLTRSDQVAFSAIQFGADAGDHKLMKRLCNKGNGDYRVVKNRGDAESQFLDQIQLHSEQIASDVDVRVEFNPREVKAYRLIGYEDQRGAMVATSDLPWSGDVYSGHAVTALYEIIPQNGLGAGAPTDSNVEGLKYQTPVALNDDANSGEVLTLKLRYHDTQSGQDFDSIEVSLQDTGIAFDDAPESFRFASAAAAFGMLLRSPANQITVRHTGDSPVADGLTDFEFIEKIAANASGEDPSGFRNDFVAMVKRAGRLAAQQHG